MWGRRTEQSRGLDDRLIENAEERGQGVKEQQAKTMVLRVGWMYRLYIGC